MGIFSIADAVSHFANIGVILSKKQLKVLEWRMSEEGKKYYTVEQNKRFYEALKKADMRVVDVIRKEKQYKIYRLKRLLGRK